MIRDSRALTDQVDFFDELTDDQKARARRTVCANAVGYTTAEMADDAAELMLMLGIHPHVEADTFLTGPNIMPNQIQA